MDKLKMQTTDLTEKNIEVIEKLFPNVIMEVRDEDGKLKKAVDFDLLKQELSSVIVEGDKERYQLTWPGKKDAMLLANTPINKTLRPVKEESVDWDNTQNLYIEGDNLEVLKLLQESYLGKVKCIYIDPPYNTGKDFIYKDDFRQTTDEYLGDSGQVDEDGNRLFPNTESNGRFHSDWLTMMYPRLKLARNLLRDDGVIFISIDDNEEHNLRKICDEIFGSENFATEFIWEKKKKPSFLHKNVGKLTEYIIVYIKNSVFTFPFSIETTTEGKKYPLNNAGNQLRKLIFPAGTVSFDIVDQVIEPQDMSEGNIITKLLTKLEIKDGKNLNEFVLEGEWRYSQDKLNEIIRNGDKIHISKIPFRPNHIKKGGDIKKMKNVLSPHHYKMETNEDATEQVTNLFGVNIFDNPKPVKLIKTLIKAVTYNDDKQQLILDFFSGSATTAHAVMQLNAEDGGNRKYIMVQLPEQTSEDSEAYKTGYKNICEIGKERIRRAAKKIREETNADIDYGFRVFRGDSSNMKDVYNRPSELDQGKLEQLESNIKEDRTAEDLLIQAMLECGLELSLPMETREIEGKKVLFVAGNSLVACFDEEVSEQVIKEIAKEQPLRVIFRDHSFKDDAERINVEEIFKMLSPATEIKVI